MEQENKFDHLDFEVLDGQIRLGHRFYSTDDIISVRIDEEKHKITLSGTIATTCVLVPPCAGLLTWGILWKETTPLFAWILIVVGAILGLFNLLCLFMFFIGAEGTFYSVIFITSAGEKKFFETKKQKEALFFVKSLKKPIDVSKISSL
ncbi:MAG: hypothetical protein LBI18_11370 [Planctomycetaceae bacterium]|jgi:hypothetical protein|nr:hypothetical protein [Planctomycetaceae bacterium]